MTTSETAVEISNQQARRTILQLQGLCRPPHTALGKNELYDLIEKLGFVQLDSIQWVERAHHMTLFARNQTYRPGHLKNLIERDRLLFENWTHDASVIPSAFFPYWRHKFERSRQRLVKQFTNWQGVQCLEPCEELLQRVRANGRLMSRELDKPKGQPKEMWQWHEGKAALEFLWRTGDICIGAREGFQKVYQPIEQGIPQEHLDTHVTHAEFVDWACRSALDRLGFGTAADIARYWDLVTIAEAREWANAQGDNSISQVVVIGWKNKRDAQLFARPDIASLIDGLSDVPKRIRALSPFDPVIRDRKRLEWLFGFEYRIEIYVPEAKRIWGYYVFPLLEGDRLIGRIDMKANRKSDQLEIKKVWLEPGIKMSNARRSRLDAELVRQARLASVAGVMWLDGAV